MKRRIGAILVAGGLCLASSSAALSGEPAPGAPLGVDPATVPLIADNTSPVAVQGRLTLADGSPTAGTVEALAWPSAAVLAKIGIGVAFTPVAVGSAVAGADGTFSLRLALSKIPQDYVSQSGQVDLQLEAWNVSQQGHSSISVTAGAYGTEQIWVEPTAGPDLASIVSRRTPLAVIALNEPLGLASAPAVAAKPACVDVLRTTYNVWSQIGDGLQYTSGQFAYLSDSSTHGATVGVGYSVAGSVWSVSGSASTTTGVSFTWPEASSDRYFDAQIQYGKFETLCQGVHTAWWFRPRFPTGGYRERLISYNPSWTNCAPVSAGLWSRTSTSGNHWNLSTAVDASGVIGIDLSLDTNYGSTRVLYIHNTASRHVCGNNNVPALAGRVEGDL